MTTATAAPAATGTTQAPPATQEPAAPATQKPQEPAAPATQKPTEQKPDETDLLAGDTGNANESAPAADVEITVPDGVEVDKSLLDGFKSIAKESKLDSKAAQKVVDLYVTAQKAADAKVNDAWSEQKVSWREAAKADKEIGGPKFEENVKLARTAISKFGGPGLTEALRDLGIGNHPEIIRFMYRVGRAMSEDSINLREGPGGGSDEEARLREAFPSMYPK